MAWVLIVIVLALLQFLAFGIAVGRARGRYGVPAHFERVFRVQMNTLEQLVMFLPALWLFAQFISPRWAAALGAVYLVGRLLYFLSYIKDPKTRGLGFLLTSLPTLVMLGGVLYEAVRMLVV
jgi:glutathione S-transferase